MSHILYSSSVIVEYVALCTESVCIILERESYLATEKVCGHKHCIVDSIRCNPLCVAI